MILRDSAAAARFVTQESHHWRADEHNGCGHIVNNLSVVENAGQQTRPSVRAGVVQGDRSLSSLVPSRFSVDTTRAQWISLFFAFDFCSTA
jgi:hypothetical protein